MESKIAWVVCFAVGALVGAAVAHKAAQTDVRALRVQIDQGEQASKAMAQQLADTRDELDKAKDKLATRAAPVANLPAVAEAIKATGDAADIELAKELVLTMLRDPSSAIFGDIRIVKRPRGTYACGLVNARNGFGGFTGMDQFVVEFGKAGDKPVVSLEKDQVFLAWMANCRT